MAEDIAEFGNLLLQVLQMERLILAPTLESCRLECAGLWLVNTAEPLSATSEFPGEIFLERPKN